MPPDPSAGPPPSIIDTHAHLSDPAFDLDREETLARARAAGVGIVVDIADTEEGWSKSRALSEHPSRSVWWSVGFHPYVADRFNEGTPARVREALRHPRAVALGEIGLDYFKHCAVPRPRQREVFDVLARLGREEGKPLVLHCREASPDSTECQRDMLEILRNVFSGVPASDGAGGKCPGVMHCFQGTAEFAREFLALGFLIGVDAPVTYPKAEPLRGVLAGVPLSSLVVETDCPYLPPQSRRGKRNEPAFLTEVVGALAKVKGVSTEEMGRTTSENARHLYNFL